MAPWIFKKPQSAESNLKQPGCDSESGLTVEELLVVKQFVGFLLNRREYFPGIDKFKAFPRSRGTLLSFSSTLSLVADTFNNLQLAPTPSRNQLKIIKRIS